MVKELTDQDFDASVKESTTPVLVDFSATWCQPCKALAPVIEAAAKEFNGKLSVYKVDIDKASTVSGRMGIQGVPTCIFFRNGSEVDRFVGYKDLKDVRERVQRVIG